MNELATTIEIILAQAVEILSEAKRNDYVRRACNGNEPLREEVERLIVRHFQSAAFLETPACVELDDDGPGEVEMVGTTVGPYLITAEIARGGMGVVYRAQQQHPVRREVALKIIKPGLDSREVISRFSAERQALALMEHPHIARALDAGTTDQGRPYFVMDLVQGVPITDYCWQEGLPLKRRLELFIQVCGAVQHAHTKGIIHRDLKPSNVLVTVLDGELVPKVIDFGIAKAIHQRLTDETLHTSARQLLGTPLYMSPEQADLSGVDVDTRSDVYALGSLLYELLTGTTPFEREQFRQMALDEICRVIREQDPPWPSIRRERLQRGQSASRPRDAGSGRHLRESLRGELDWIVMKALHKDRSRRYQSAGDLAEDIRRYLRHEPVEAQRVTYRARVRKWFRRHPAWSAIVLIGSISVLLLAAGGWWHNLRLREALKLSDRLRSEALERESDLRLQLYASDMQAAWRNWKGGNRQGAIELLLQHQLREGQRDCRDFVWYYLQNVCRGGRQVLRGSEGPLLSATVSPDQQWLASSDRSGTILVQPLRAGGRTHQFQYSDKEVTCVRFSPDGRTLATCGQDRTVRLWDVATWCEVACWRKHDGTVSSLDWSPDGRWLATAGRDHRVFVWDAARGELVQELVGHADVVRSVVWSPDGEFLATGGSGVEVFLWKTGSWQLHGKFIGHSGTLCMAFSPDGQRLAVGGYYRQIVIFSLQQRLDVSRPQTRMDSSGHAWSIAFSPDGRLLAAGLTHGAAEFFETANNTAEIAPMRIVSEHNGPVRAVVFVDGGKRLLTASEHDRTIHLQDLDHLRGSHAVRMPEAGLLLLQDGDRMRMVGSSGVYDAETGHVVRTPAREVTGWPVASSADSRWLALGSEDGRCRLWNVATWSEERVLPMMHSVCSLAFSRNTGWLACGDVAGEFRVWEIPTGRLIQAARIPDAQEVHVGFSPDGRWLVVVNDSGRSLHWWDVATWQQRRVVDAGHRLAGAFFSPDGKLLATGGADRATLWETSHGQRIADLAGHRGGVDDIAFSPDGLTLATLGSDEFIRLWHLPTGRELISMSRFYHDLRWIRFAADGRLFCSAVGWPGTTNELLIFDGKVSAAEDQPLARK